jgi:hypothetical protein
LDVRQEIAELQLNWTSPRELATCTPRQVELSGKGIGLSILATLLLAGGIMGGTGIAIVSGRQSRDIQLVKSQGQDTEAHIVTLFRGRDKERTPGVTYEFETDGRTYKRTTRIPLRAWTALHGQDTVAIRYLAADPSHNYLRDIDEGGLPMFLAPFIAVIFCGGGTLILLMIHRERRLLEQGRPAPAIVIKLSHAQHGQRAMIYTYPAGDGAVMKGRSGPSRKPAPVGSILCILYDRERPRRSTTYPTHYVRLVR